MRFLEQPFNQDHHPGGHLVPETGHLAAAPGRDAEPAAAFWASQNAARWQTALAVEHASGLAIRDTDPLKPPYAGSPWQPGDCCTTRCCWYGTKQTSS